MNAPSRDRFVHLRPLPALLLLALALVACVRPARAANAVRDSASWAVSDWRLPTADGGEASLHAALARGPVLVSFWALWCAPCLRELPHLDALARELAGRVTVLAVNQDTPRGVARVRPYLHTHGLHVVVPLDTAGEVARQLQVGDELPFLVLYDAHGREAYRHVGYHEGDEAALRARLLALLGTVPADTAAAR